MSSPFATFTVSASSVQQTDAIVGIYIEREPGELNPLIFDCTLESSFAHQAEITNNPIEANDGDVTDHRRTKPRVWRFRAVLVSEDQDALVVQQRSMAASDAGGDPLASARANGPKPDPMQALNTLHELIGVFRSSATVTVYTDLGAMENAVLETLDYKALASGGVILADSSNSAPGNFLIRGSGISANVPTAIEVSGSFREVRFATTKTVELPAEQVKRQTGKKQRRGTVQGKPASDEIKQKAKSVLKGWTKGLD